MRRTVTLALILTVAAVGGALRAQQEDETEEQRRRDEAYLERQRRQHEQIERQQQLADDPESFAQAYVAQATELIRDKNHRSVTTEHYLIRTDDPRLDVNAAGELLERFRAYFATDWSAANTDRTTNVFLFYSYYKYNQLIGADFSRQWLRPKGHFGSTHEALVLHTDSDPPGGLPNTLVHEATHQLLDELVYRGDRDPATWITEGLATYYENTWMGADGFHPGEVGGKHGAILRGDRDRAVTQASRQLRMAREALREARTDETPLGLRIVSSDRARFFSGNVQANYASAWIVVHYLLHADDGAYATVFRDYVAADADGRADPATLLERLGMDPRAFDAALLEHAKSIKVR